MKHLSQTLKVGLALIVAIFSSGLLPATSAYAAKQNDGQGAAQFVPGQEADKVFVCKYSGTPNVGEKAQTVNSVAFQISGSNDPSQWRWPGTPFNDAQGLSYVLAWDLGQDKPSVEACPTLATVPVNTAQINDPCGVGNATWILPADTATVDWSVNGSGHLIATAQPGYMFINGTLTVDFGIAPETNTAACIVKIQKPIVPIIDACGLANITYGIVPTSSDYTYVRNLDGSITFTAKSGLVFDDGSAYGVTSYTLPVLQDSGELCRSEPIPTPQPADPCGLDNAYWIEPNDTYTVHWSVINDELIATTVGVLFTDGRATINFGAATDSGDRCVIDVPAQPSTADPCGIRNATWVVPSDTEEYTWAEDVNNHLVATTTADYVFEGGSTVHDFGLAPDSGTLCPAPEVVQPSCETDGTLTLPAVESNYGHTYKYRVTIGLETSLYSADEETVITDITGGTYYVELITDGELVSVLDDWTLEFDTPECVAVPIEPTVVDCDTITIPEDTDQIHYVESYTGTSRIVTATAQGKYLLEDGEGNLVKSIVFTLDFSGLECGKGEVTPPAPTPLPTPLELPRTGSDSFSGWLVAAVSAIAVYGAVYFAQPRRS